MSIPKAGYTIPAGVEACDDAFVMPSSNFEECGEAIIQDYSEVAGVIIALPDATDPTTAAITVVDPSDPTEWETHLGTANADHYHVIGDVPQPTKNSRPVSRGRTVYGDKDYVLNFDIDETTDENYELTRSYAGRPTVFLWYYTKGNKIYGGTTGIRCQITDADAVNARGADAFELYQFVASWKAKTTPPRSPSPFTIT
jgi:hypothetical protein